MSGWNFKRGEGAPTKGLWFRSAVHGDFGPWMMPEDFFDFSDPEWAVGEAADLDPEDDGDEIACRLTELAIGSRTEEEGRPERFVIEAAYNGATVLTAVSNIEWDAETDLDGEPDSDGDVSPYASPYASPWSSEIDHAGLKAGATWWMAQSGGAA